MPGRYVERAQGHNLGRCHHHELPTTEVALRTPVVTNGGLLYQMGLFPVAISM